MATRFKLRKGTSATGVRQIAADISHNLNLPMFIACILARRGVASVDEARRFMHPTLEGEWENPYKIDGMPEVVSSLEEAIGKSKHIVVFGDFDLDGISATAVMARGIRELGGHVTPFIPHRLDEGYGITAKALGRVMKLKPDVLVTVDCGISCRHEVEMARESGMEVLVTDHHEAGENIPVGVPLIDPKLDGESPSHILAGVGVALKVVQALGSRLGYPYLWREYTDFAALGTVADLMPMIGENRSLVCDGIARMNEKPRSCIAALADACGMSGKKLTSQNLSFSLIPRLNAAGRMGNADLALDLLMTDSFEAALQLAQELDALNGKRRKIEAELLEAALDRAEKTYGGERALVVYGEGWHEGIKGIVAARLVGKYGVPSLLFTIEDGQARGSGRSFGSINLFKAVESTSDLLTRFGGHEAAVGVTLPAENLDEFHDELCRYMETLPDECFQQVTEIDSLVSLDELTLDSVGKLDLIAPFGQENPEPVLLAHNILLEDARLVGADKNHLSCRLTDGTTSIGAILFRCGQADRLLRTKTVADAAFTVQVDEWRGVRSVKAMLKCIEPARSCEFLSSSMDPGMLDFLDGLFWQDECVKAVDAGIACAIPGRSLNVGAGAHGDIAALEHEGEKQGGQSVHASRSQGTGGITQDARKMWEGVARADPARAEREIIRAIIGDGRLHEAQRKILDLLDGGKSVLGIMATGRGKSLIFQVHAALLALKDSKASLFIYPLRALMADQAFGLSRHMGRFGISCCVLNGETPEAERQSIYEGLRLKRIDIVLTTPEYLSFHVGEISSSADVGFMVVDEAHHVGQAKAGNRVAYGSLAQIAKALGDPPVFAATATAPDEIANGIGASLPIGVQVVDATPRKNLLIDDKRGLRSRDDYLAHIVADGGKCVVYVNSREQSVDIARRLRFRVPAIAPMIGFYNAGLDRGQRSRLEDLFRAGKMQVLVSTSAFGEGVDIPDIRHVVLFHMPFSHVEFNQMAGRAGRDGRRSWVHLLYGRQDVPTNEGILGSMAPNRSQMAHIYRMFKRIESSDCGNGATMPDLVHEAERTLPHVTGQAISCAISVFSELGLIEVTKTYNSGTEQFNIHVVDDAGKVELTDSARYCEGLDEIDTFNEFRNWAIRSNVEELTSRVQNPMTPAGVR